MAGAGEACRAVAVVVRSVDKPLGVLGPFARQLDKKLTTMRIAHRGSLVYTFSNAVMSVVATLAGHAGT